MKNAALRKTRKKSRTILVEKMPETKAHNDTLDLDLPILLALVKDLPPGYRKIFKLYAIDGLPHDKIARKLKISEGTSKSQLSRAKRKLQDQVKILFSI
jgi:RNA polymerase sigma-70 factor (ECF subfamily)